MKFAFISVIFLFALEANSHFFFLSLLHHEIELK